MCGFGDAPCGRAGGGDLGEGDWGWGFCPSFESPRCARPQDEGCEGGCALAQDVAGDRCGIVWWVGNHWIAGWAVDLIFDAGGEAAGEAFRSCKAVEKIEGVKRETAVAAQAAWRVVGERARHGPGAQVCDLHGAQPDQARQAGFGEL